MPVYHPHRVEYAITQGRVTIIRDDGAPLPAYWAQPALSGRFPGIALIHDWWGITGLERRLAHLFAGLGYVVIVPDLFNGRTAVSAREALLLVEALGNSGLTGTDAALKALENHARVNLNVAVVGLGLGGGLAFEAAIARPDLEAAVAFYGFPQRVFGRIRQAQAPILAIYGERDPFISSIDIIRLRAELDESPLEHEVLVLERAARDFLAEPLIVNGDQAGTQALEHVLRFLDRHLSGAPRPPAASR
jgi:carboxymethylenebutenolidase